jgi:hypothetical protein
MRRAEVHPADAAQLAALDRALAGAAVDEAELELAALVESVRADAPRLTAEALGRLDTRVDAALTRELARRHGPERPAAPTPAGRLRAGAGRALARRRIPPAGLGALALSLIAVTAVAAFVVLGVVNLRTSSVSQEDLALPGRVSASPAAGASGTAAATSAAPSTPGILPNDPGRLQQKAATLTLVTSAASLPTVADQIVAGTEQLGGVVETSDVTEQGSASIATFSLSEPSANLAQLITALSRLAQVRSLTQSTQDITDSYGQLAARLADGRARRDALYGALARATTPNQTAGIQDQIDALNGRIAADQRALSALGSEARTADVQVTLQASAAPAAATPPAGTLRRALDDALAVLRVSLAVAIVALACLLPLAIVVGAGWWGSRALRRRSRERALELA